MPYIPLPVPAHAPKAVRFVCRVIDGAFQEIRSIMEVEATYGTSGKDQFQRSLATLLLSATDGASQIFIAASERDNGKRFTRFLHENFPWHRVQMDPNAACTYMWGARVARRSTDSVCTAVTRFENSRGPSPSMILNSPRLSMVVSHRSLSSFKKTGKRSFGSTRSIGRSDRQSPMQ